MWTHRAAISTFLLGSILFFNPALVSTRGTLPYGNPCLQNATVEALICNLNMFLTCNNETSLCGCDAGMHLDPDPPHETCVAKFNETCKIYPSDGNPAKYCTPNALCLPDGAGETRCYCKRDFPADDNGACTHSSTFGGSCTIDEECRANSFLTCGDRTCVCDFNNGTQVWSGDKCLTLIGGSCTPLSPGLNRTCVDETKTTCEANTCQCREGTASKDNSRCVKIFAENCTTSSECADGLQCIFPPSVSTSPLTTTPLPTTVTTETTLTTEPSTSPAVPSEGFQDFYDTAGTCGCASTEKYNEERKECEILANQTCSTTSDKTCVANSQCIDSICTCTEKYLLTAEGTCAGNHGANCTAGATVCSASNFLRCNGTTCECNPNYEYSATVGKCIAPIGNACNGNENCDAVTSVCTGGRCACRSGFVTPLNTSATVGTKCLGDHDSPCDYTGCDATRFLNCSSNNMCACVRPSDQIYDSARQQCIAYADAACDIPDFGQIECVENSVCDINSGCKCTANFHAEQRLCKENSAVIIRSFWLPLVSVAVASLAFKMQF